MGKEASYTTLHLPRPDSSQSVAGCLKRVSSEIVQFAFNFYNVKSFAHSYAALSQTIESMS